MDETRTVWVLPRPHHRRVRVACIAVKVANDSAPGRVPRSADIACGAPQIPGRWPPFLHVLLALDTHVEDNGTPSLVKCIPHSTVQFRVRNGLSILRVRILGGLCVVARVLLHKVDAPA